MDTQDPHKPTFAITADEAAKIKADFLQARMDCAKKSVENMKQDIELIDQILVDIQVEDVTFEELITPLHNLFCIVPQEQVRFLKYLRDLFKTLPMEVKTKDKDVKYARKRLKEMKNEDLDTKIQTTDLSIYWAAFRVAMAKYGFTDYDKQIEIQENMKKEMLKVAANTVAKRTLGIESAQKVLANGI